jgi:site-specific DNA recombinase
MKQPVRAAIYARISSDQDGQGLGVGRQVEDGKRLAEQRGWHVVEVFTDNDISAYKARVRPGYQQLLAAIEAGEIDAVIVWRLDRLTRRPRDLEDFISICDRAGMRTLATSTGDADLAGGDGLLVARIMASVAQHESDTKGQRVRRKMQQNAELGLPHGGANRPFGYGEDRVSVVESEAVIIRTLVERLLAGESLRSLATWLDETGVKTVRGMQWRTSTLRAMLCSPRIAGLRSMGDEVIGPAVWAPIVTIRQRERVLAHFETRRISGRREPRSYLLSGMLRCGKCGNKLFSSRREHSRRYVCLPGPDHRGCGRLTVVAEPVEELIADAVLYRLDTPTLADALAGRVAADEHQAALSADLGADQDQLSELAELYATRAITAGEWMTARNPIEARIRDARRRLARGADNLALHTLAGTGQNLRAQWAGLNLTRQAAIVRAVLDHAIIKPGTLGARTLDPSRVDPRWKM